MKCEEIQDHLSDFFEGSLSPEATREIQNHLSACTRCQADAEALAQTRKAVKNLPSVQPPPGFSKRVMARVREEEKTESFWKRNSPGIKVIFVVNAVALLGVIGLTLLLKRGEVPQQMQVANSTPSESQIDSREFLERSEKEGEGKVKAMDEVSGNVIPEKHKNPAPPSGSFEMGQGQLQDNEEAFSKTEKKKKETDQELLSVEKEKDVLVSPKGEIQITLIPERPLIENKTFLKGLNDLINDVGGSRESYDKNDQDLQTKTQVVMVNIPSNQVNRFRTDLRSLGTVEFTQGSPDATEKRLKKAGDGPITPSAPLQPTLIAPAIRSLDETSKTSETVQIKLTIFYPKN